MKMFTRLTGVLLLYGSSAVLHAQYTYSPPVYSPLTAITSDVRYQGVISSLNDNVAEQVVQEQARLPTISETSYDYNYSRALTQQNLRNFVNRSPNSSAKAELEGLIASQPNLMGVIGDGVRAYGFDPHNVADAYAVWWINVWGTSQKTNIEPDAATVAAVKQQVRSAFAATSGFAETSDAQRQEYAEALLLQAALLGSAFEQLKSDPAQLEQLAEAARQGAKAHGLDLSMMTLTPSGFVPR